MASILSVANTYDWLLVEPLVDAVPAIVGPRDGLAGRGGGPKLPADTGDDYPRGWRVLRCGGITAWIARRSVDSGA